MITYEMIGLADENGREYECKYGTYNRNDRFRFNEEAGKIVDTKGYRGLFDILVHENLWKLKKDPVKEMSLAEIEKELGYRVRIVDPCPEKKISKKKKKEVDDTVKFFRDYLGVDLDPEDYY